MDNNIIIITLAILVMLSAFFSASETAFSSVNRIKIKNMANDGNPKAKKVLKITDNYSKFLSTILVGNNIVNIFASSLATLLFVKLMGEDLGVTYSTVIMTLVILTFGEISPKSIAKEMPERWSMAVCNIILFLMTILTPINWIFDNLKKVWTYLFHVESNETYSSDEFITIVEEAHSEGGMDDHEADLLTNAIEFNDMEVKEILTPRVDVVAEDVNESLDVIEKLYRESGFSRIPIYEDTIDNVIGVLHEKDFYRLYYTNTKTTIRQILQPVVFTSPQVKISYLLRQLQNNKSHMAIVVDEYGGTEGIITMEDILEELVGEIYDEHDVVEEFFKKLDDTHYLVKGDCDIEDMFDYFKIDIKEEYDFNTVSAWVIHNLDKIPSVNDSFDFENMHVTITDSNEKKVNIIEVELKENTEVLKED